MISRWMLRATGLLLLGTSWEVFARLHSAAYLPAPTAVFARLAALLADGTLIADGKTSVAALLEGLALANVLAIVAAVVCRRFYPVWLAFEPVVESVRGLPPLALLPAFLLLFGIGLESELAMILWVAWPPIFVNVMHGVKEVDPRLVEAARSMNASDVKIFRDVIAPSTIPYYIAGLRLAAGASLLVLVAAEMLGASSGIGYFILETSQSFHITDTYAAVALLGVIGITMSVVIDRIAWLCLPWRRVAKYEWE